MEIEPNQITTKKADDKGRINFGVDNANAEITVAVLQIKETDDSEE